MPQSSFALLTNTGRAKEAAALANATTIEITHIAIGDGATVPSGGETELYSEVARKTISGHGTVVGAENVAYFDCYLAAGDGPYTIREAGLYDVDGDLIAIAHYDPPINKPVPASGQTVEGSVRLEVAFSNVATVIIKVDPSMQVALQRLTRLPWIPIIELGRNAPPAAPAIGDVYVIGTAPTGSWAGQAGKIAEYTLAGWAIIAPPAGHGVSLPDGRVFERIGGDYVEKIALDAQSGKWNYAAAGGTANALMVTLSPKPEALVAGMMVVVGVSSTNTGPATLDVNGLGAKSILTNDGKILADSDLLSGAVVPMVYDGAAFRIVGSLNERLLAPRDYYVATTGNDNNSGLDAGHPFRTIQKAINTINQINLNGFPVTVNIADGTYAENVSLPFNINTGDVTLLGNVANPSNCIVSPAAGAAFRGGGINIFFKGLYVSAPADAPGSIGNAFWCGSGGRWILDTISFGTCSSSHVHADAGCSIFIKGEINIFGGAIYHMRSVSSGGIYITSGSDLPSLRIRNNVTFSRFVYVYQCAVLTVVYSSITNPERVTGQKYVATANGVINTAGAGASYFPGTTAGATTAGGQYL